MAAPRVIAVAALATLGLAACNDTNRQAGVAGGGNSLCTPFAGAPASPNAANAAAAGPVAPLADPAAQADDCLHRWGYALAASSDPAESVAQATVAACGPALSRWNQQAMGPTSAVPAPAEAPSLVTGETTNPVAGRYVYAQGRALFYVVQARAGKCSAPPMSNGVPTGLGRD